MSVSFGPTGGGRREGDRGVAPTTLVIVSELGARSPSATHPALDPARLPIDRGSFDDVMERLAPALAVEVPDPICPDEPPLRVDVRLTSLRSFRPDALVEQSPVLRSLREIVRLMQQPARADEQRVQLQRVAYRASWVPRLLVDTAPATGSSPAPAAVPAPPAASPAPAAAPSTPAAAPPEPAGAPSLSSLLAQMALAPSSAPPPAPVSAPEPAGRGRLSGLVQAVVDSHRGGSGVAAAWSARVDIAGVFQRVLGAVVGDPELRRLEQAWRGVKLVADAVDARRGVRLEVVPMAEGQLVATLGWLARPATEAAVDLLVVDQVIDAPALDLLAVCAAHAWSTRTPVLLEAATGLLGVASLDALGRQDAVIPFADRLDALARDESAAWVTLVTNGPLARLPYAGASSRLRDVAFEEGDAAPLYLHGVHVVAALAARSAARHGWPSEIEGPEAGVLPGLPVREQRGAAFPLASLVPTDAVREAAGAGVAVLTCASNRDVAVLTTAPTLAWRAGAAAALGDQLFVGRLGRLVLAQVERLGASATPGEVTGAVQALLGEAFAYAPPPGPTVDVAATDAQVTVTVSPRRCFGARIPSVELVVQRPR